MKSFVVFIGLLVLPAMVYYQKTTEITGVVMNADNQQPLPDSHVYISGTNIGTVAGEHGEFSLSVPMQYMDRELIVSYVGFATFEKKLVHIRPFDIQVNMRPDVITLDEVVVMGHQFMIDEVLEEASAAYDDREEMIEDMYFALFEIDHDLVILKRVIGDENLYGN